MIRVQLRWSIAMYLSNSVSRSQIQNTILLNSDPEIIWIFHYTWYDRIHDFSTNEIHSLRVFIPWTESSVQVLVSPLAQLKRNWSPWTLLYISKSFSALWLHALYLEMNWNTVVRFRKLHYRSNWAQVFPYYRIFMSDRTFFENLYSITMDTHRSSLLCHKIVPVSASRIFIQLLLIKVKEKVTKISTTTYQRSIYRFKIRYQLMEATDSTFPIVGELHTPTDASKPVIHVIFVLKIFKDTGSEQVNS